MEILAGKFYKTRDGRKAYVVGLGNPMAVSSLFPAIGWVGRTVYTSWSLHGREYADEESPYDLVDDWYVNPAIETVDAVLLRRDDGTTKVCTGGVGCGWTLPVLARRTITLTEGEGV